MRNCARMEAVTLQILGWKQKILNHFFLKTRKITNFVYTQICVHIRQTCVQMRKVYGEIHVRADQ